MICPTCKSTYETLVCPNCTNKRSRQGYLDRFRDLLPAVIERKILLRTAQAAMGRKHLELYGDPSQSLCGEPLAERMRRTHVEYDDDVLRLLCPKCRETLEAMMNAAAAIGPSASVLQPGGAER
jgi:hypothetical protein